jgi:putative nucleotidyltransferase with HDIG domain
MKEEEREEILKKAKEFFTTAQDYIQKLIDLYTEEYNKRVSLEETVSSLQKAYKEIATSTASIIEEKSEYRRGHAKRVSQIAEKIAERLYLSDAEKERLRIAALLHDIGNIKVGIEILDKPGLLTESEYDKVKEHPKEVRALLGSIEFLNEVIEIIKCHHERYDGKGYPEGKKGEMIPLEARILALADAYDAMTSPRPYRQTKSPQEALREIEEEKGRQFDPLIVEAFSSIFRTLI